MNSEIACVQGQRGKGEDGSGESFGKSWALSRNVMAGLDCYRIGLPSPLTSCFALCTDASQGERERRGWSDGGSERGREEERDRE